jgi:type II secretory pathway component PulJ
MTARPARQRRGNRLPARRGVTIVEVLVLMTAVAAILGMTVILLQLLFRLDLDARNHLEQSTRLGRLARQFRRDAHAATTARLLEPAGPQPGGLRLEFDPESGRVVIYRPRGQGFVERLESANGEQIRREDFDVSRGAAARVMLREESGAWMASLTIARGPSTAAADARSKSIEILALVGKDHRRRVTPGKSGGDVP